MVLPPPKNLGGLFWTTVQDGTNLAGQGWQLATGGDSGQSIDLDDYPANQMFDIEVVSGSGSGISAGRISIDSPNSRAINETGTFILTVTKEELLAQAAQTLGSTTRVAPLINFTLRDFGNARARGTIARTTDNRLVFLLRDYRGSSQNVGTGIGVRIKTPGSTVVPTALTEPNQLQLGTGNLLDNFSSIISGAQRFTTSSGNEAIRFDETVDGSFIGDGITYDNTTGEIMLPAGAWNISCSAMVQNFVGSGTTSVGVTNTLIRNNVYFVIREGLNYPYIDNKEFTFAGRTETNGTISILGPASLNRPTLGLPSALRTNDITYTKTFSISGGEVISTGMDPVTIRVIWSQNEGTLGGITVDGDGINIRNALVRIVKQ